MNVPEGMQQHPTGDGGFELLCATDIRMMKRGNHDNPLSAMAADQAEALFDDIVTFGARGFLDFDIDSNPVCHQIKHFIEERDTFVAEGISKLFLGGMLPDGCVREFCDSSPPVGGPIQGCIVDNNHLAIGAAPHVELNGIGPAGNGSGKRGKSVLRGICGASAMRDDNWQI